MLINFSQDHWLFSKEKVSAEENDLKLSKLTKKENRYVKISSSSTGCDSTFKVPKINMHSTVRNTKGERKHFVINVKFNLLMLTTVLQVYMGYTIQEWSKYNLWKTAFKKFYLVHSWILGLICRFIWSAFLEEWNWGLISVSISTRFCPYSSIGKPFLGCQKNDLALNVMVLLKNLTLG